MTIRTLISYVALCAFTIPSFGDWRGFRGSASSGLPEETVANWDGQQEIAWQVDLPGRGLSSPILVGERLFVTCSSGPLEERLHVLCFDAKNGSRIWHRQFWATGRTVTNPTTCVDKNRYIFPSSLPRS